MKKVLLVAAVALSYGTAYAGMYHAGSSNICADCHTMHSSMAHDYNGASPVSALPKSFTDGSWLPSSGIPAARLLKGTETAVCVACHDGKNWAPDVVGGNTTANVRSAGFIPAIGVAADQHKGHTMEYAGGTPGSTPGLPTWTDFTCASCHSPHGKAEAFRNLNPYSLYAGNGDATGYPRFALSTTPFATTPTGVVADVRIAVASYVPMTTNTDYYANAKVIYENGGANKLDKYCGKCHGQFHDDSLGAGTSVNQNATGADAGHFIRHPTNNEIGSPAGPTGTPSYTTKVYATSTSTNGFVGCLSCHKAHGTANPFNLFYAKAAVTSAANVLDDSESGTGTGYGNLCSNCHGMAR